jgi:hypothetical protein
MMPPFLLVSHFASCRHMTACFDDENMAREAWLEATRLPAAESVTVERIRGPHSSRFRCEWDCTGTFVDRSEAHCAELRTLCSILSRGAPLGYGAAVVRRSHERVVELTGARSAYRLVASVSTVERVRRHWQAYAFDPLPDEDAVQRAAGEVRSPQREALFELVRTSFRAADLHEPIIQGAVATLYRGDEPTTDQIEAVRRLRGAQATPSLEVAS